MGLEHMTRKIRESGREIMKLTGLLAVLLLLMMWLSGVFVGKIKPGHAEARDKPGKLKTWTVRKTSYPLMVEQTGTVRAQVEAQVSSRIMAQVSEILVREGDILSGGGSGGEATLLARLDDREIQARLRQAEAQLAAAEQGIEVAKTRLSAARAQTDSARASHGKASYDLRRFQALAQSNAISGQQLDHSRTQREVTDAQLRAASGEARALEGDIQRLTSQRDALRAAVAEARTMLTYTMIYAPFDGRLIKKNINRGDLATPGQVLFVAESNTRPELQVFLSESILPHLRPGQEFSVKIDALHRTFPAKVREIIPQSDPATRTIQVKLDLLPDPKLVNGLFGRFSIPLGEYSALTVPVGAVQETGQLYLLRVLDGEGHPQRRFVTPGRHHGSFVEVLSGVREGEEVVIP